MTMLSKYAPKECAKCGKLHICTGTVHCPCFDVKVSEEILDFIAIHFDECLCNDCMEELKNELVFIK
jgi:hypothetical protein